MMPASVERSSASAARLSLRSESSSAVPAAASAIAVVASMTIMSLPLSERRAWRMDASARNGRPRMVRRSVVIRS
jgi:hypothetical protein